MPATKLYDVEGKGISVIDIDGTYIVDFHIPNQEDIYRSISTWEAREDDILIWAYPKSGTHWLWDILYQIYQKKIETVDFHKTKYMLEALSQEKFDALPSPRIINTHIEWKAIPQDLITKRCKVICMVRNPKDIAVSFYHHHCTYGGYEGKWENYLPMYLSGRVDSGSWFDHIKEYEDIVKRYPNYPIHLMYYEDLHRDGINELKKLMAFLEIDIEVDVLEKVYEKNRFQTVKKDKEQLVREDRLHAMWMPMYRKGLIGDWKHTFTVAQNELFEEEYKKQMKHSKIDVTWT